MPDLNIVIVEDEFFAATHLEEVIEELGCRVVAIFHSGEDFINEQPDNFDAAFLDIFLDGEITGLNIAANELKPKKLPFVFLTANQDSKTLKEAAQLHPIAYLSKPFKDNDIAAVIEILKIDLGSKLAVPEIYGNKELVPNEILYLKADGNYTDVVTHKKTYKLRKTIKNLKEDLPESFVQVHRSYVVNPDHISQKTGQQLLVGKDLIPISRNFKGLI